jgi:hypothetical protein
MSSAPTILVRPGDIDDESLLILATLSTAMAMLKNPVFIMLEKTFDLEMRNRWGDPHEASSAKFEMSLGDLTDEQLGQALTLFLALNLWLLKRGKTEAAEFCSAYARGLELEVQVRLPLPGRFNPERN